jgi:hypothetical protein
LGSGQLPSEWIRQRGFRRQHVISALAVCSTTPSSQAESETARQMPCGFLLFYK